MSLQPDQLAVISGGASGIGLAIVRALHECGLQVVSADVQRLDTLPEEVQQVKCDVSAAADIDSLFGQVHRLGKAPRVLVCCAGIHVHERLDEGDPEKWRRLLEVNLMGTLRLIRAFVPAMMAAGGGHIIVVSSVAGRRAYTYGGAYAASKAALDMICETLRLETQPTLSVTRIAPGLTKTSLLDANTLHSPPDDEVDPPALAPADVARAVMYALQQPDGVAVNDLTIRPNSQEF